MINDDTQREIKKMREKGMSIAGISKAMGISRTSVYKILLSDDDQSTSSEDEGNEINHSSSLRDSEPRQPSIRPVKGKGGPMSTLKEDAYRSTQYDFKTEMLEDEREEYRERKNRARREEQEQVRLEKLERFRIVEQQRQAEESERKARVVIQRVKEAVLPLSTKQVLPASVMSSIYGEIEKVFSRMDIIGIPFDELIILGTDIKNRILGQNLETVRQSACEYLLALSRNVLRESFKEMYSDYRESGGELPMRDFILDNAGDLSPEKQREFLNSIGL